jgi:predicted transcriptional regulator
MERFARDKFQMIKEVLVSLPGIQTHVMFRANLSFWQAKYIFQLLLNTGLMIRDKNQYIITPKGERFLDLMDKRGFSLDPPYHL